ncbi:MAG: penicillin acylase family protein, partial [Candidatus Methylomirabilis sp.]|nr:penicillin acylase family protein [Deltaproteobacteria bacterium]
IGTTIFYAWAQKLGRATFDPRTADLGVPPLDLERRTKALIRLLEGDAATGDLLFDDPRTPETETREETILAQLDFALGDFESGGLFDSANPDRWRWGVMHALTLSSFFDQAGVPLFINGPLPRGGGQYSVDIASWDDRGLPLKVSVGANTRMIHRVKDGAWETWNALPGGQSGVRGDPHFEDNLVFYLRGEYYKIPFYPEEVAAAAESHWVFRAAP